METQLLINTLGLRVRRAFQRMFEASEITQWCCPTDGVTNKYRCIISHLFEMICVR